MTQIEQALFQYYTTPFWVRPKLEVMVFDAIIAFRKVEKTLPEEDRSRIRRAIADYNNRLHKERLHPYYGV